MLIHGPFDGTTVFDFRRSRRRQRVTQTRGTNASTKKTYDNLENLIADISAEKVTAIDFSTFRNIHKSTYGIRFLRHSSSS